MLLGCVPFYDGVCHGIVRERLKRVYSNLLYLHLARAVTMQEAHLAFAYDERSNYGASKPLHVQNGRCCRRPRYRDAPGKRYHIRFH